MWHRFVVFHIETTGDNKVHSAYMALTHLWFDFVACLQQGGCSSSSL